MHVEVSSGQLEVLARPAGNSQIRQDHTSPEQPDLDRADLQLPGLLHLGAQLKCGVLLDYRQANECTAHQQYDEGGRDDRGFFHASASGCLAGCARSNAGSFMQASWMR